MPYTKKIKEVLKMYVPEAVVGYILGVLTVFIIAYVYAEFRKGGDSDDKEE